MKRGCLSALMLLTLAGCATTHTNATPSTGVRDLGMPATRPDLSDTVTGGIQSQELNSVIPGGH